jgi:hypothetical protein
MRRLTRRPDLQVDLHASAQGRWGIQAWSVIKDHADLMVTSFAADRATNGADSVFWSVSSSSAAGS